MVAAAGRRAAGPLGLLGYLGYVVVATHRLDGWFWVERHTMHMVFDWGASTLSVAKGTLLETPSVGDVLVVGTLVAAVLLMLALPVARLLAPLRTSVLVPLIGVLTVATTWFALYLTVIERWTP